MSTRTWARAIAGAPRTLALAIGLALVPAGQGLAVDLGYPTPEFPFYWAAHTLDADQHPAFILTQVRVNGAGLSAIISSSLELAATNRNSTGWVVPILVEPFDEGVEGAVGGGHD